MVITVTEEIHIGKQYKPFGIVWPEKNGCCKGRPIVLTKSGYGVISAQCACGGWCTNGHKTATVAVKEYECMSRRGVWDNFQSRINELEDMVIRLK